MRTSGVVLAAALTLSASSGLAEPLDKAKSVKFGALLKAKVLGLHVAEVDVGEDGALRIRAGLEIECGSIKGVKKVEGKCVVALPAKEIAAASLDGWLEVQGQPSMIQLVGTIGQDGWLAFRATRLTELAVLAGVDASHSGKLTVTLATKDAAENCHSVAVGVIGEPDPHAYDPPPSTDRLAIYAVQMSSEDDHGEWDGDGCGGDFGDEGYDCGASVVTAELPASWFAYAGQAMQDSQQAGLLSEYAQLARARPAAFWSRAAGEWRALRQLPRGGAAADALVVLARGIPDLVAERVASSAEGAPALDRTSVLYEGVMLLAWALAQGDSDSLGGVGAEVLAEIEQRSGLDAAVAADVEAFTTSPEVPAGEALSAWEAAHRWLLRDARYAQVAVSWIAARGDVPFGTGAFDGVVSAAIQDEKARATFIEAARRSLAAHRGKSYAFPWGYGSPSDTFRNVGWFLELAWDAIVAHDGGIELVGLFAEYMVASPDFDPALPQRFLAAHPAFFESTDAGRRIALAIVPKVDARARADKRERIQQLDASRADAEKACSKPVKEAKRLAKTWDKKFKKLKPKQRDDMRARYASLSYEIQSWQHQLRSIVTQLTALEAYNEADVAITALAACSL